MNRDVDAITSMPYVSYLFWQNFFKLDAEAEYRRAQ